MTRLYDPTRAQRHWVYSRSDLCKLFDISESTITNWIKEGLKPVDLKRPQLFAGFELRRFITNQRWPHGRLPEDGRLFCQHCLCFRALAEGTIDIISRDIRCPLVKGKCTDCDNMLQSSIDAGDIPKVFHASANTPKDSSDVSDGLISRKARRNGSSIPPETNSSNLRWLHDYKVFLENHQNWDARTVDEHLRAVSRMSAFFAYKAYEKVTIADARRFKDTLRDRREQEGPGGLSKSTVLHTLDRCRAFFKWLQRQPDVALETDLPGYFNLSRKERASEASEVKGTSLNFNQALCMFNAMPVSSALELRNRAIIALFIVTGIRVAALISLRGRHVNTKTRWINQDPRQVDTKLGKHIRTYCLDLGSGLLTAIEEWARWRKANGFGDDAAFFLPSRYIQPNAIGLGYRKAGNEVAECWKSEEPVQQIIKDAAFAAGIPADAVSSHDFRKVLHPFLAKQGKMMVSEEVALQLNLGHTPKEVIRKHYALMLDNEREEILDELCRRALTGRSELELYLAYERGEISEADSDFERAKEIFERNVRP